MSPLRLFATALLLFLRPPRRPLPCHRLPLRRGRRPLERHLHESHAVPDHADLDPLRGTDAPVVLSVEPPYALEGRRADLGHVTGHQAPRPLRVDRGRLPPRSELAGHEDGPRRQGRRIDRRGVLVGSQVAQYHRPAFSVAALLLRVVCGAAQLVREPRRHRLPPVRRERPVRDRRDLDPHLEAVGLHRLQGGYRPVHRVEDDEVPGEVIERPLVAGLRVESLECRAAEHVDRRYPVVAGRFLAVVEVVPSTGRRPGQLRRQLEQRLELLGALPLHLADNLRRPPRVARRPTGDAAERRRQAPHRFGVDRQVPIGEGREVHGLRRGHHDAHRGGAHRRRLLDRGAGQGRQG
mmetsp:Transcript_33707/g.80631  ORF Transcript_33707/g.80631 Transcript_33707/m.80631 type:complete len:351 (-) Transcript_33707:147-1199(-)